MEKRRVNFYYCPADNSNPLPEISVVETALAINGIKAYGYSDALSEKRPFDYSMVQKGAEESLLRACDMVIFSNYHKQASKPEKVLHEAEQWGLVSYTFRGEATDKVKDFAECIAACQKLLGRKQTPPILI